MASLGIVDSLSIKL